MHQTISWIWNYKNISELGHADLLTALSVKSRNGSH